LITLVNRGVIFANCASLAVSKYLGISRNSAALQNLAADIARYVEGFIKDYSNERTIVGSGSMNRVLQKNGHKKAETYGIPFKDFMNNLKVGEKVILTTSCYNKNGKYVSSHAITIKREKKGYGVFDTLLNGGEEVIYSKNEFIKFMNGKSAKGKTLSGRTITKPTYYTNTTSGVIRYKPIENEKILILTDSKDIKKAYFKTTEAYKYMKDSISIINKLLKQKGISSLSKTWLKKAKSLVNSYINNSKSYLDKSSFGIDMFYSMEKIAKEKASIISLVKYSSYSQKNFIYHVLYPLRTVLKDNITYKIYTKYGEEGINVINELSRKYNKKETEIYNKFVKVGITSEFLEDKEFLGEVLKNTNNNDKATKLYAEYLINNLLKKGAISETAVNWLNGAKDLINNVTNSSKSNSEKERWLQKALTSIKNVNEQNATLTVLEQESSEGKVFASLQKRLLKDTQAYTIRAKYGEEGVTVISALSKQLGLEQKEIYEQFLKNEVSYEEMKALTIPVFFKYITEGNYNTFSEQYWAVAMNKPKIGKTLEELKKMAGK
jgi:hypothetical protein